MIKKSFKSLALLSLLGFVACPGQAPVEKPLVQAAPTHFQADELDKLPTCGASIEGALGIVKESDKIYACNGKDWQLLTSSEPVSFAQIAQENYNQYFKSVGILKTFYEYASDDVQKLVQVTATYKYEVDHPTKPGEKAYKAFEKSFVVSALTGDTCVADEYKPKKLKLSAGTAWLTKLDGKDPVFVTNHHVASAPGKDTLVNSKLPVGAYQYCNSTLLTTKTNEFINANPAIFKLKEMMINGKKTTIEIDDSRTSVILVVPGKLAKATLYLPKTTLNGSQVMAQGLSYSGWEPSTTDFDAYEVTDFDWSTVAKREDSADLALIKPTTTMLSGRTPLPLSASTVKTINDDSLKMGDEVFSIGYPLVQGPRLSHGPAFYVQTCNEWLQTDFGYLAELTDDFCVDLFAVNKEKKRFFYYAYGDHGGSGSPVFNKSGQVVGVHTWGNGGDGHPFNSAQFVEEVRKYLAQTRVWQSIK